MRNRFAISKTHCLSASSHQTLAPLSFPENITVSFSYPLFHDITADMKRMLKPVPPQNAPFVIRHFMGPLRCSTFSVQRSMFLPSSFPQVPTHSNPCHRGIPIVVPFPPSTFNASPTTSASVVPDRARSWNQDCGPWTVDFGLVTRSKVLIQTN
jgi:hypothetical protein